MAVTIRLDAVNALVFGPESVSPDPASGAVSYRRQLVVWADGAPLRLDLATPYEGALTPVEADNELTDAEVARIEHEEFSWDEE
jgi:hypothetical protein